MTVAGGLRARLIRDSVYRCLYDSLEALEWFKPGRAHRPISFTGTIVDESVEIPLNTLALADGDLYEVGLELGSNLAEMRWTFYLDFYAENDVVGKDLINDARDILAGRMHAIGRSHASVMVFDYRVPEPHPELFRVGIEDVEVDRANEFPKPWLRHWYSCRFVVVDAYG